MSHNYRQIDHSFDRPAIISTEAFDTIDTKNQTPDAPPASMEAFLVEIEKKAYHMAAFATHSHADAMDLLQDAMIKLVTNYADKPAEQWKPLFYKILQNRIRDWHRQQKVKNLIFFWQSPQNQGDDTDDWLLDSQAKDDNGQSPESDIVKSRQQQAALKHLATLSEKQQQSFLLRSWEGMSTAQTALAMGCSEGSVKTHYSRAVTKLRELMEADCDITF